MKPVKAYRHDELLSLLKTPLKLKLIDVRDTDFGHGGRIKYCQNIPSFEIDPPRAKTIIGDCLKHEIDDLVCYCSYGRARSVQCATLINEILADVAPESKLSVGYLDGGFTRFRANYFDPVHDVIVMRNNLNF